MKVIAGAESPVHRKKVKQESGELARLIKKYSEVQLATLVDTPPEGELWLHETKFDGYRLLGFVSNGTTRIHTRNGKDWTESFPSLTAALQKLSAKSAVLDMEAVVVDAEGKSSFQALQSALGSAGEPTEIVGFVFDLLQLDGNDVTQLP
jgi:bifunctional non-homologous end joining protein LigD